MDQLPFTSHQIRDFREIFIEHVCSARVWQSPRLEARASLQLQLWSDCGGKSWKLVECFCIFEPDEEDMKLQATGTTYLLQCCLA